MIFYYPPCTVFDPYRGIYGAGYRFVFAYNGASVPWIISVNSFQFFTYIWKTMSPTNMYYRSFERSFDSASGNFCCIKTIQKWLRNHRINIEVFIFTGAPVNTSAIFTLFLKYAFIYLLIIQNGGYLK